jgi:selenide, water dikinase
VLGDLPLPVDDRVVVDFRTADDAGVYRWEAGPALVQTVDFFTPIVDDPYVYGQIAAANAVSDVYAMGGRPLTALAIAAFPPSGGPDQDTVKAIFRGGHDKLREAGVVLLGGHTVQDTEIKFGYAVTGAVDPDRVLTNAGARPGDVLLLTKPLGTGAIATAIKFERAPAEAVSAAIASMTLLNRAAADVLGELDAGLVHACTDISGFGLLGHACEMAAASRCTLRVESGAVPLLPGALELAVANVPAGARNNRQHFGPRVSSPSADPDRLALLYDPQTSGGLLVAVAAGAARDLEGRLSQAGVVPARIGVVEAPSEAAVTVG